MKSTLTCLMIILLFVPNVYAADYPRHIDPKSLEIVEPEADMLFLLYHNLLQGMVLENFTIQEEWFEWASEVFTVPDLDLLLDMYGDQLLEQSNNLNLTQFYLDQVVAYIGKFDLESAKASFFKGLAALQASNQSLPILELSTIQLGERLRANPELLLNDLEELGFLVEDYRIFAQTLVSYIEGGTLSEEDVERLKDIFSGVIDADYLENIGDIIDPKVLTRTQLSLTVSPESVIVGDYIQIDGRLTSSEGGLEGKLLSVSIGDEEIFVTSGIDGAFNELVQVPYIYEDTVEIRCIYWPKGGDVFVYSPATAFKELELVYYVPELEYAYSEALPGLDWNVSGYLTFDGVGLEGFTVTASLLSMSRFSVSDETGFFEISVPVDPMTRVGVVEARVQSVSKLVYSGVYELISVQVVKMPLSLRVDASSLTLSGGFATLDCYVEADGVPLDGCFIRVTGEDVWSSRTVNGSSTLSIYTDLFRTKGEFPYTVTATPKEPWIGSASISGSFPVFSSLYVIGYFVLLGLLAYYNHFKGKPRVDSPVIEPEILSVEKPVEPVIVEPSSFSWLYHSVLRFIESFTGVVAKPSDTIREYLRRITNSLSDGVRQVFDELSLLYERWLYDRPFDVDVERVKVLVQQVKEDKDED